MKKASKLSLLTDKEFTDIVNTSNNMFELFNSVGYKGNPAGRSSTHINNRLKKLGFYDGFKKKSFAYNKAANKENLITDILVEDSSYMNRSSLKRKIIRHNAIEYKCDICGNEGVWLNKKITLQLDHINGVNNDNRVENLRFLCPNCHSQTETYTGKNSKKKKSNINVCIDCGTEIKKASTRCGSCSKKIQPNKRPERKILEETLIENKYNFSKVGRIFGVSDNAIRKWCKFHNIHKNN